MSDIDSLRCFLAAAQLLNFRLAAKRVALSPPALSDRIHRLEEGYGVRLFERTTRRVSLTEAGQKLVPQAERVLSELARCAEVATDSKAATAFELVIGTRYELGLSFLVPNLSKLEKSVPERHLHVYFGDTQDLVMRTLRQEIDACITSTRSVDGRLSYERLHAEQYVFVATPRVVRADALKKPEDALKHVLIDVHTDLPLFRYFIDHRPAREEWTFAHTELLGTIAAVRSRVLEGAGVAVLPHYFVRDDLAKKRLICLMTQKKLGSDWFRLLFRRGHPHERELRALATELRALPLK
jgi:LysR family glycine cleavage system transcriptional activator